MRPSRIASLVAAVLLGLGMLALAIVSVVNASSGKPWHYWVGPLVALLVAGLLLALALGYYVEVGRLESRGRPTGG